MKKYFLLLIYFLQSISSYGQIPTLGLTHYYPFNSNTLDAVGTLDGVPVGIPLYATDRFGIVNACYNVIDETNHINLPADVWVSGDYSISAWVNIKQITQWPRLFDFGNGYTIDNAVGKISNNGNSCPTMEYYITSSSGSWFLTTTLLNINTWYHLVYIQSGTTMEVYVNNVSVGIYTGSIPPQNVIRTSNKIGGSNAPLNDPTKAHIDDFRIYNRALEPEEVGMLYNETHTIANSIVETCNETKVELYPNPTNGICTLNNKGELGNGEFILYNLFSQRVLSQKIKQGLNTIDMTNLSKGVYSYQILAHGKNNTIGKIVLK